MTNLKYFKVFEQENDPVYSTQQAACFDICACLIDGEKISGITKDNAVVINSIVKNQSITLMAQSRMLIPTGLIFDIPIGWSLRLHPRSGLAYKYGIMLSNCEGVIDSDYYQQTFVAAYNTSNNDFVINHGDRIAQAEMVQHHSILMTQIFHQPQPKTDRVGGFGSTGLNT